MTEYDKRQWQLRYFKRYLNMKIVIIKNMYEITFESVYVNQNQQK